MSIASVLIASDKPDDSAIGSSAGPRYSLLLSTDPAMIEAAQRLRHDVFSSTPGFTLPAADDHHLVMAPVQGVERHVRTSVCVL